MRQQSILMTLLFALAGGILLIIFHSQPNLFESIVVATGVLFMLPSAYMLSLIIWSFINGSGREKKNAVSKELRSQRGLLILPAAGGIGFGILLVSAPAFFVHYIIYTFAVILCSCGMVQTLFLAPGIRYLNISAWWIVIPLLTIVAGIGVFIVHSRATTSGVALYTGIWLICYALNGMISYLHRESRLRQEQLLRS